MNQTSNLAEPRSGIYGKPPEYDYVIKCWYNDEGVGRPGGYRYWTGTQFVAKLSDKRVLRERSRIRIYREFAKVIDNNMDKVVKVRRKT